MTAEQFLVLTLSGALTVFLITGIVALIKLVQVLNRIKAITDQAEKIGERVEEVASYLRSTAAPLAAGKALSKLVSIVQTIKHKEGGGHGKK